MVFNIYFVKLTQIFNQKDKTEFNRYIGSRRCGYPDKEAIEPYGALPRRGISYATRLKGLKGLKGILALTLNKFCCTRHSQGESQEGYTILYKFHLVFCARLLNFDMVQVRRRFGKMQTSLLFRSPCTNFVVSNG